MKREEHFEKLGNMYAAAPITSQWPSTIGEIHAVGRVVHPSKSIFLAEAEAFDSEGHPVGRANGAFVRSKIPLGPDVGYM